MRLKQKVQVLSHQGKFLQDTQTKYLALVGGYGCGKTKCLAMKALNLALRNPGFNGCLVSPTYSMAIDVLMPGFEEHLDEIGIPYRLIKAPLPKYTLDLEGGRVTVFVRSFEHYRRLVALNLAWAVVDELDTVDPKIARPAFKKLMARIRTGRVRQIAIATTPEGFAFVWEFWERDASGKSDRRIIRASTYDNPFLPADYIETLKENYPPELIQAYLMGEFVNLTQGCVYSTFDRRLNNCNTVAKQDDVLHIGMDFNVGKMAAVVHVIRLDGFPDAVDELSGLEDTPQMIAAIKSAYPYQSQYQRIAIYPDASGGNSHTTNASESDLALLRQAGFTVLAHAANPRILDRVNAMKGLFHNSKNERRYRVNVARCPQFANCLEKQPWDNGKPDKKLGFDHLNDAAGYFVHYSYPIVANTWTVGTVGGGGY